MDKKNVLQTYAAYAKDSDLRLLSSSGAMFSLMAEDMLKCGGVVYGVVMSNDCKFAEFIRADSLEQLAKIRSSKYLQAKVGNTFRNVKDDLDRGIKVLFTGVGCQISGLRAYLGQDFANLYCMDIICHGVPSPALWRKYVDHVECKNNAQLISVNFRCKDKSWADFGMKEVDSRHRKVFIPRKQDAYMQMFLKNYCLRPSCYECVAKEVKTSDITVADFWGIEEVLPQIDDGKGVSLVLLRTEKGCFIFDRIKDSLEKKEVTYEQGVKKNPVEFKSVNRPIQRNTFFVDMNLMDFDKLSIKYLEIPFKRKVKNFLLKKLLKMYRGG